MNIDYYTKEVYGITKLYIANPMQAQAFEWITGRKTLKSTDMTQLSNLTGATFNRVFEPTL